MGSWLTYVTLLCLGKTNSRFSCSSSGLAAAVDPADMAEQLSLGCQVAQIAQGLTAVSSHLGPMKRQGLHASGCPSGFCFILQVECHYKCQLLRMGHIGAPVQPMGGGLWKTRSTHQCAGVVSSLACSQAFPATPKGEVFPCTV